MLNAAITPDHFDAPWARHYATPDGLRYWPAEELVRFLGRHRDRAFDRVLEVGCGNGANLWCLAEHSLVAIGLDRYGPALGHARRLAAARGCGRETPDSRPGMRRWKPPVVLVQGDLGALPLPDASVDLVVDSLASQHVPWQAHAAAYAEYRRVLRHGGLLFLYHLTNRTQPGGRLATFDHRRVPLFPEAGFTCLPHQDDLQFAVVGAGFRYVELRGVAKEYPDRSVAHYAVIEGEAT